MDPDSSVGSVETMTLVIALATQIYMAPAESQPSGTNLTLHGGQGLWSLCGL